MEKESIPYTEALALKELGFDEHCLFAYNQDDGNRLMTAPQLSSYYINTGIKRGKYSTSNGHKERYKDPKERKNTL